MAASSSPVMPRDYTDVAPHFECPLCQMRVTARKKPGIDDFYVPPHDDECVYYCIGLQRAEEIRKLGGDRERKALRRSIRRDNDRSRPGRL